MQWIVTITESAYGPGMSKRASIEHFGSLDEAKDVFVAAVAHEKNCRIYLTERDGQSRRSIMEAKVI